MFTFTSASFDCAPHAKRERDAALSHDRRTSQKRGIFDGAPLQDWGRSGCFLWISIGTLSLMFTACTPAPPPVNPTATLPAATASPFTPPTLTPTLPSTEGPLRVWLPPNFALDSNTPGGDVLAEQIAQFEAAHAGRTVEVRLKQEAGAGGLLKSLSTAYNVAPDILPDLIALNYNDLITAARAGLVIPLDEMIPPETMADYYPFAQAMSRVDGKLAGLPFAAEARMIVYNTEVYPTAPHAWADVITGTIVLPAAEPSGLTLLSTYLALGGTLADSSGNVALDSEVLAEALTFYQSAQSAGFLPLSTLSYDDPAATWQVFRERRATLAVTSTRWYLAERARVSSAAGTLLLTADGAPFTFAEGWSWAVVNTPSGRQAEAGELLLWLTDPAQLSEWTMAAGVLPPRAEALEGWGNSFLVPLASDLLTSAQLPPPAEVLNRVGLPLRQTLDDVLSGRTTPFTAANIAAQTVANP